MHLFIRTLIYSDFLQKLYSSRKSLVDLPHKGLMYQGIFTSFSILRWYFHLNQMVEFKWKCTIIIYNPGLYYYFPRDVQKTNFSTETRTFCILRDHTPDVCEYMVGSISATSKPASFLRLIKKNVNKTIEQYKCNSCFNILWELYL